VQVSSRVWASQLVTPSNKVALVASWISGEAALTVPSGETCP
jgi:hypothetical protein